MHFKLCNPYFIFHFLFYFNKYLSLMLNIPKIIKPLEKTFNIFNFTYTIMSILRGKHKINL